MPRKLKRSVAAAISFVSSPINETLIPEDRSKRNLASVTFKELGVGIIAKSIACAPNSR